jgi:hypothetical protein
MHVLVFKIIDILPYQRLRHITILSKYIVTNISIHKLIIRAGPIIPIFVVLSQSSLNSSEWSGVVATIAQIKSMKLHEESCEAHP